MKLQIVFLASFLCAAAQAQPAPVMPPPGNEGGLVSATAIADSRWQLGFAVGHGRRENPLALSDDFDIVFDVDVGWFGDRWFFDNGDGGLMLADRDAYTLNLIGRFNSDRVFFSRTDTDVLVINLTPGEGPLTRLEVPDRDFAVELGLELLTDGDWGYLQAAINRDASGTHDGFELYANYGRNFRRNRWSFEPSLGFSWKSDRLNDYYWGVREEEANFVFPAYGAESGLNRHARFAMSYRLSRHWALFAVADYERLNSSAARSPVADDKDVRAAFVGFSYSL